MEPSRICFGASTSDLGKKYISKYHPLQRKYVTLHLPGVAAAVTTEIPFDVCTLVGLPSMIVVPVVDFELPAIAEVLVLGDVAVALAAGVVLLTHGHAAYDALEEFTGWMAGGKWEEGDGSEGC